ncbi:elongin A, like [Salminus brasiliensis]|uniref:elongin A, like n=1 Tax=Salminus brasiliensis TaxID=930266 RepID=UPI003B82E57F
MASVDVKKVLQLKLQLKESAEGHTLVKILKKLQELDITLDILAETGIGKVVNSFRKHNDAGEVAKMLIHRWKKLVPKDPSSVMQPPIPPLKEQSKSEVQQTGQEERDQASESMSSSEREPKNESFEWKPQKNPDDKSEVQLGMAKLKTDIQVKRKEDIKKDARHLSQATKTSLQSKEKSISNSQAEQNREHKKIKKKVSDITNKCRSKSPGKRKRSSLKEDYLIERQSKKKRDVFKQEENDAKKTKLKAGDLEKDPSSGYFETPSISFEACLNYDIEATKRRKKSHDNKQPKHLKTDLKKDVKVSSIKSSNSGNEVPTAMASKGSMLELLNVPLPPISTECEDLSQYQYFVKRKVEEKPSDVLEDTPVFTGQRLNKKMQVYSGSKAVYLPTMMTLYQQCIRTLQNNIDSLYEIGGVPFEILEPVLERCTPEQLLRIEECNPVYIGVTDHLWEKHCCRDFKNARLEEYESWREMYLRLFEEREHKLQQLTKSIVLAHSGKPKGRQVKMAFIHSAAKPPRNVRIQQELHGTAGVGLPHPTDKPSGKSHESRARPCFSEPTKHSPTILGSNQCQDPRKIRRVAPMMAKSLKAFKKQLGRR